MSAQHNQLPQGELKDAIERDFGSLQEFVDSFKEAALSLFGSGWVWLVSDSTGKLSIVKSVNAENPLGTNVHTLIACDVWEHAYYIDTRNDRAAYITNFMQIVNYAFALDRYKAIG